MDDDCLVYNATRMAHAGFRGYYGWSLYNEPLLWMDRIERVQRRIASEIPGARFLLWTNGTRVGHGVEQDRLRIFDKIYWSNYTAEPRAAIYERMHLLPVHVVSGKLDRRMTPGPETRAGCKRITCELVLDNCVVPKPNVLGEAGKGYKIAIETLNEGRIAIGGQMVVLARGALNHAVAYAKQRKQCRACAGIPCR